MPTIDVHNVTKTLNGRPVLRGISFSVKAGEIFGILGPNGAGKTTTVKILLGLLQPTSGHAFVFGAPLGDHDDLRRRVGVLLEHDGLYEGLSAYENLNYYARLYHLADAPARIRALLDVVGLSDRRESRVGELSTGMKRRLALARSILHDPDVLFFDEPSAGLDPAAQKMVRDLILHLAREKGRTIFLTSHDLDEAQRICSTIAILHHGALEACDSLDHLRQTYSPPVMEVALADADEAQKAQTLLASSHYVSACEREDTKLRVVLAGGHPSTILAALVRERILVDEVRNVTKSMEDIYLDVIHSSEGCM